MPYATTDGTHREGGTCVIQDDPRATHRIELEDAYSLEYTHHGSRV
jgi:hypothetical protein